LAGAKTFDFYTVEGANLWGKMENWRAKWHSYPEMRLNVLVPGIAFLPMDFTKEMRQSNN
jgi:hypothetical protein